VPWAVTGATAPDFVTAWKRFRVLQQQILPQHKLVFCPNDGTSASQSLDWRKAFPGAAYVDEMAVDSYNQYPFATTAAQFATKILAVDSYGAPVGIEKHRQFAASVGRPLAIAEWSSNSGMGDSAAFVQAFYAWVAKNAGTGAGEVPYEVMFNVVNYSNGVFSF
jgi:beta-mannanase